MLSAARSPLIIKRSTHFSCRAPNYKGWWTLILKQPTENTGNTHPHEGVRTAVPIPVASSPPVLPPSAKQKQIVFLNGEPLEVPAKPEPPDNCCMSGCAHCVWDIYQEDMEEYQAHKAELRSRFEKAGQSIPPSLVSNNKSAAAEVEEEMDPTMKAFLAMERKLGNR